MPQELRREFTDELRALEQQTMDGLGLVAVQLDRVLEVVEHRDMEVAGRVIREDDWLDAQYRQIHAGLLSLMALQAPLASDLRTVAALMYISRCVERMGDQCVTIAKLAPLSGHEAPTDPAILDLINQMGSSVRQQTQQVREAFMTRDVALAQDVEAQDLAVNRLNRELFVHAVDAGGEPEIREWAMFMVLVGRCLERIGDNTVDIAEQTTFVATGMFRDAAAIDGP